MRVETLTEWFERVVEPTWYWRAWLVVFPTIIAVSVWENRGAALGLATLVVLVCAFGLVAFGRAESIDRHRILSPLLVGSLFFALLAGAFDWPLVVCAALALLVTLLGVRDSPVSSRR